MANDHYTEGIRIAGSLRDLDGPNVNPLCHTRLYTHGRRTEQALVLLHGFTNCPQQFDALANRAAEAGAGLGERLTVAGLSLGAILTGLVAQERDGIERAVLIAPMLGLKPIPGPVMNTLSRLVPRLPNFYMWWNRKEKDGIGPPYGYPRFATHAYAALFQSGARLVRAAQKGAPRARSI